MQNLHLKILYAFLISPTCNTCPANPILICLVTLTILDEKRSYPSVRPYISNVLVGPIGRGMGTEQHNIENVGHQFMPLTEFEPTISVFEG
jgi:hypothetical protein